MREHGASKGPSQRQSRVAEEVRHALAQFIARGDFMIMGFLSISLTITEVSMSPDLRNAMIYVSALEKDEVDTAIELLNKNAYIFKKFLAKAIYLRTMPQLRFKYDTRLEYAQKIETLLNEIKK